MYHTCTCTTDDLKENIHNAATTDITPEFRMWAIDMAAVLNQHVLAARWTSI
jgi:hypothetical protein